MNRALIGVGSLALGFGAVYLAFQAFRMQRKIEDTPTCKVRSIAMGLVEVNGKVVARETIISPFSKKPCVYFHYTLEQLKESKHYDSKRKRWIAEKRWVPIRRESDSRRFLIEDETGKVLVEPKGAEVKDFEQTIVGRNRHTEWLVLPDSPIYLLGTAAENPERGASADSSEMVMLGKGEVDKDFIISSKSEKQVTKGFRFQFEGALLVALALFILGAWLILTSM